MQPHVRAYIDKAWIGTHLATYALNCLEGEFRNKAKMIFNNSLQSFDRLFSELKKGEDKKVLDEEMVRSEFLLGVIDKCVGIASTNDKELYIMFSGELLQLTKKYMNHFASQNKDVEIVELESSLK